MKTLKQISDDEQAEAHYAKATQDFIERMRQLDIEHEKNMQRIDRNSKILQRVVFLWAATLATIMVLSALFHHAK